MPPSPTSPGCPTRPGSSTAAAGAPTRSTPARTPLLPPSRRGAERKCRSHSTSARRTSPPRCRRTAGGSSRSTSEEREIHSVRNLADDSGWQAVEGTDRASACRASSTATPTSPSATRVRIAAASCGCRWRRPAITAPGTSSSRRGRSCSAASSASARTRWRSSASRTGARGCSSTRSTGRLDSRAGPAGPGDRRARLLDPAGSARRWLVAPAREAFTFVLALRDGAGRLPLRPAGRNAHAARGRPRARPSAASWCGARSRPRRTARRFRTPSCTVAISTRACRNRRSSTSTADGTSRSVPSYLADLNVIVDEGAVLVLPSVRGGGELRRALVAQRRAARRTTSATPTSTPSPRPIIASGLDASGRRRRCRDQPRRPAGVRGCRAATRPLQRVHRPPAARRPASLHAGADDLDVHLRVRRSDGRTPKPRRSLRSRRTTTSHAGSRYPAMLIAGAEADIRCPAWHGRKFAARLARSTTGPAAALPAVAEGGPPGGRRRRPRSTQPSGSRSRASALSLGRVARSARGVARMIPTASPEGTRAVPGLAAVRGRPAPSGVASALRRRSRAHPRLSAPAVHQRDGRGHRGVRGGDRAADRRNAGGEALIGADARQSRRDRHVRGTRRRTRSSCATACTTSSRARGSPGRRRRSEPEIVEREGLGRVIVGRGTHNSKACLVSADDRGRDPARARAHARCGSTLLVDGEEEIGSPHLGEAIAEHRSLLSADAAFDLELDCGALAATPSSSSAARACSKLRLSVRGGGDWGGPGADVHSGEAAWIASPAWALVHALASPRR